MLLQLWQHVSEIDSANMGAVVEREERVEHYQIAVYGAVRTYAELMRTYAELLEQQEMAGLLQETLDEKKGADETLSNIASSVNVKARGT